MGQSLTNFIFPLHGESDIAAQDFQQEDWGRSDIQFGSISSNISKRVSMKVTWGAGKCILQADQTGLFEP